MDVNVYLLKLSISGIKNIEKDVELNFYKKTINRNFDPEKYRVKAIYGENGSGKTAIITGVSVAQKIMLDYGYLSDSSNQRTLSELINKKSQCFRCAFEFIVGVDKSYKVYRYFVCVKKSNAGDYVIDEESLQVRSAVPSSRFATVFDCVKGKLDFLDCDEETYYIIDNISKNLLETRSFMINVFKNAKAIQNTPFVKHIMIALYFVLSINVFIDTNDRHDLFFLRESIKRLDREENFAGLASSIIDNIDLFTGVNSKIVSKAGFANYEHKVARLLKFLQLFKPDLRNIEIDKKENKDYYECSLILVYDGYSVHNEFESTGIRRLIKLFDYLDAANNNQITFIDEMDANINDVYLCRMVEFFVNFGTGQICFTTHNTSPMSILRHNKMSIDFLTSDNRIIPWRTNGNFSPESLYKNGMIEYIPFNISAIDFVGILGGEDNE